MEILNYVVEKAIVLIPVLYIIGMMLKQTPKVLDWLIPWVLMAFGIIGAVGIMGASVEAVIQGILVAGATVFTNQIVKQTINK